MRAEEGAAAQYRLQRPFLHDKTYVHAKRETMTLKPQYSVVTGGGRGGRPERHLSKETKTETKTAEYHILLSTSPTVSSILG